jgi:hypothetical protein
MGQEAVPTLPNSNLDSSLKLPNTDYFATDISPDNCSIALTSLRKLANGKSCSVGQRTCSIQVISLSDLSWRMLTVHGSAIHSVLQHGNLFSEISETQLFMRTPQFVACL